MSTPRRPSAGRRPARPGGTRTVRTATTPRATAPRPAPKPVRRSVFTPRTAVLALVAGGLLASAALPLREYVNQRSEIAALEADQAAARERVAALEAEKQRLQDPAYVAAEARRRLHFVLPGETAYVVLAPEPTPEEEAAAATADAPWYTQLWGSVQEADRPTPKKQ